MRQLCEQIGGCTVSVCMCGSLGVCNECQRGDVCVGMLVRATQQAPPTHPHALLVLCHHVPASLGVLVGAGGLVGGEPLHRGICPV